MVCSGFAPAATLVPPARFTTAGPVDFAADWTEPVTQFAVLCDGEIIFIYADEEAAYDRASALESVGCEASVVPTRLR